MNRADCTADSIFLASWQPRCRWEFEPARTWCKGPTVSVSNLDDVSLHRLRHTRIASHFLFYLTPAPASARFTAGSPGLLRADAGR